MTAKKTSKDKWTHCSTPPPRWDQVWGYDVGTGAIFPCRLQRELVRANKGRQRFSALVWVTPEGKIIPDDITRKGLKVDYWRPFTPAPPKILFEE